MGRLTTASLLLSTLVSLLASGCGVAPPGTASAPAVAPAKGLATGANGPCAAQAIPGGVPGSGPNSGQSACVGAVVAGVRADSATVQAPRPKPVQINAFPPPDAFGTGWTYYRETGHYVGGAFKRYLDTNGGVDALGFPITEELVEDGWTVQYFQRARLEMHPENPSAPVERALLGDMLTVAYRAAEDPRGALHASVSGTPPAGARFFPETGHWLAGPFLSFFDRNGGVAALGYPIEDGTDTVLWTQRARLEAAGGTVQAALIGDEYLDIAGLAQARAHAQPPHLARADLARDTDDLDVFASPGGAERVTRLPQDAQVRVTGEAMAPNGETWFAVRLWNAVDGYVRRDGLAFTAAPDKRPGADGVPWKPPQPPAQGPFPLRARGTANAALDYAASPDGPAAGKLAAGANVPVTAWGTDARGRVWFQFAGNDAAGWVLASALPLDVPASAATGDPRLRAVAGKGMWFTYDTLRETPPANIVTAAQANGFTFLAPEVGTSRRGYWAGAEMDALLPLAHAAGLKVIPWVYPWLTDVPGDLQLALTAARYVAPSGDRVDGLGVDLEENLDEATNRAFGELLRVSLGADPLLIAIVYQPQIASGQRTPYGAMAETYDVIAPMSYWHVRPISYTYQAAYDYVAESVRLIRERTGRSNVPVAVLGQTFDWFSRNEIGPGNPTGDEMRGALQAARDTGTLGIGFFNWFSTTPDEWDALQTFGW